MWIKLLFFYWKNVIQLAFKELGIITAIAAFSGAVVGTLVVYCGGLTSSDETANAILIIILGAIIAAVVELTIRILYIPAALEKKSDELKNRLVFTLQNITKAKKDHTLFAAMIQLIKNDKLQPYNLPHYDSIGAIIHFSSDIENEDDLNWYCNEFVKNGYEHPLNELNLQSENLLVGNWLPVLQMARLQDQLMKCENNVFTYLSGNWNRSKEWTDARNKFAMQMLGGPDTWNEGK